MSVTNEEEFLYFVASATDWYYAAVEGVENAQNAGIPDPVMYWSAVALSTIVNIYTESPNMRNATEMAISKYYDEKELKAANNLMEVLCSPLRYAINEKEVSYGYYGYVLIEALDDMDVLQDTIRDNEMLDEETKNAALYYIESAMRINLISEEREGYEGNLS